MPPRRKRVAGRRRLPAACTEEASVETPMDKPSPASAAAETLPAVAEASVAPQVPVEVPPAVAEGDSDEEVSPVAVVAEAGAVVAEAGAEVGGEEAKEMEVEAAATDGKEVEDKGGSEMEAETEVAEEEEPEDVEEEVAEEEEPEDVEEEVAEEEEPEEVEEEGTEEEAPEEVEEETAEDREKEQEDPGSKEAGVKEAVAAAQAAADTEDLEEVEDEATHGDDANEDGDVHQLNGDGDVSGSENDAAEIDEVDPSLFTSDPVSEGKSKEVEIFVGGLPKDCVEEDITKVFSEFGQIESVKIVKNPITNKIKGFAFVRYANTEAAKKTLAEFKEGTEVKGKKVRISASQDNNTLYLGNICKTWTKDQVLNTLRHLGIEELEMSLPDDPDASGRNKGFAFLEFASHSDAISAFQRLRKPDAIFGTNRSAKVSFAQTPLRPSEDLLMKVKTVYLEHVPLSWDEEKIKECCKEYGEIQKVCLFRESKKTKKKDFSFVGFDLRESALACVEGINNAKIGDGEVKLAASLARPLCKGRLAKQGTKGGYKVNNSATVKGIDQSKKKKAQEKEAVVKKNTLHKLSKGNKSKSISQDSAEIPKSSQHYKGKRQARGSTHALVNERPSKKARKNRDVPTRSFNRRPVLDFGNAKGTYAGQVSVVNMIHPAEPRYASNRQAYFYAGPSGSNPHTYDLEPHAGYLLPANRVQSTHAYDQRRAAPYDSHQISGPPYAGGPVAPQPGYSGYASYAMYQTGYSHRPPPSGSYPGNVQNPRRGYY